LARCTGVIAAANSCAFCALFDVSVPARLDIHQVMENYGARKTPSIEAWFARHRRFQVQFTPTSASWLNQVERWFATLAERYLRWGTHRSTRQLEDAIRHYLDVYNANPQPFAWSQSADEILASLERFCGRVQPAAG
jgi:transposase